MCLCAEGTEPSQNNLVLFISDGMGMNHIEMS
ncbi:hypothetical protein KIPB_005115, partial [Kipferlia bialata]|eukprot:g5115.t1